MATLNLNDDGFMLDARSIAAIERVVRRVLETDGRKPAERRHGRMFSQNKFFAKTIDAIPARSGDAMGNGEVTMYKSDDSGNLTPVEIEGDEETRTAYNLASEEVAADTYIQVVRIGNVLVVDFEDCG